MDGFRYVSDTYDWKNNTFLKSENINSKPGPLMSEKIKTKLLFEELDFSKM